MLAGQHLEQGQEIVAIAKIVEQVFDAFVILSGVKETGELDGNLNDLCDLKSNLSVVICKV